MKYILYIALFFSLPSFAQEIEAFPTDEARINDRITMTIPKAEFDKRFKKADSITAPTPEELCGRANAANIKMVHYKGAKFELNDGTMHFRSVDFTKNRNTYLSIKNDWFDRTTTLKSFSRTYPGAAAYIEDVDDHDGDLLEMITLVPDSGEDFEWRFYFKDERLKSIECWSPCD